MQDIASLRPITVMVCALGGEGGGVLAEWLIDTAIAAGYPAQSTSVPGVAQRTGATSYYIEVFPVPAAQLQGRRPVFALTPVPGDIDVLVAGAACAGAADAAAKLAGVTRVKVADGAAYAEQSAENLAALLVDTVKARGLTVRAISITGHADRLNGTGNAAYNSELSRRRMVVVRDLLASSGLNAATGIKTEFVGDSQPLDDCRGFSSGPALRDCLQSNRRVEVTVEAQTNPRRN